MDEILGQRPSISPPVLIASIQEDSPGPSNTQGQGQDEDQNQQAGSRKRKAGREDEWLQLIREDIAFQHEVLLTHVDPEAGPSVRPDDTLQEPPRKRKCKRTRQPEQRDDAYETLLSRETERAEMQIRLAKEQIQLCRLQQTETSLRIQLLKAPLDDPAAFE
ncbi:hypothetical protein SKAU_G00409040 [Synaphobranchus kaupii]|uniref:Uncharacterized protein n=1 Tax=Synaphobranchus kaupii TaxID=118154 RepID=A0A9Q1ICB4_SYNKA|nr:hypothetical protein SKAU_G00409040 [Synaphobranchus kaupii]